MFKTKQQNNRKTKKQKEKSKTKKVKTKKQEMRTGGFTLQIQGAVPYAFLMPKFLSLNFLFFEFI